MSFVLEGRRSCAVVGRVAWSQKKFYARYHGSLNEDRGEAWWEEGRLSSWTTSRTSTTWKSCRSRLCSSTAKARNVSISYVPAWDKERLMEYAMSAFPTETENTGMVRLNLKRRRTYLEKVGWNGTRHSWDDPRPLEAPLQEQVNTPDFQMKSPRRSASCGSSLSVRCQSGDSSSAQIAPP